MLSGSLFFHRDYFNLVDHSNCTIHSCFGFEEKNLTGNDYLFITEPIANAPGYEEVYKAYRKGRFKGHIGCVSNGYGNIKAPLYALDHNFEIKKPLVNKRDKFCALLNRHDDGRTRTEMYNRLSKIGHIECAGDLFRNININIDSHNKKEKIEYLSQFKFVLCPENWDYNNIDGYITEKLMDACLAGCIPIYAGWFDDIDARIFNNNRIIRFKSRSNSTMDRAINEVKIMLEHYDTIQLLNPFMKHAQDELDLMKLKFIKANL